MRLLKLIEDVHSLLIRNVPIVQVMLGAHALAAELGNPDFLRWVKNEQLGYPPGDTIPNYRYIECELFVEHTSYSNNRKETHLEYSSFLDASCVEKLKREAVSLPVGDLEKFYKRNHIPLLIKAEIPSSYYEILRRPLKDRVVAARQVTDSDKTYSIVDSVRFCLMDFITFLRADSAVILMGVPERDERISGRLRDILFGTVVREDCHCGNIVATEIYRLRPEEKAAIKSFVDEMTGYAEIGQERELGLYLRDLRKEVSLNWSEPIRLKSLLRIVSSYDRTVAEAFGRNGLDGLMGRILIDSVIGKRREVVQPGP